jgi:hypothetical protein
MKKHPNHIVMHDDGTFAHYDAIQDAILYAHHLILNRGYSEARVYTNCMTLTPNSRGGSTISPEMSNQLDLRDSHLLLSKATPIGYLEED